MPEEDCCDICGEPHKLKYVQTLKCNHSYHYECILKTFTFDRKKQNECPLCRAKNGLLPLVNGLPKLIRSIHYIDEYPLEYQPGTCTTPLKTGKRKGLGCGAKCMIGLPICKRHHNAQLKKEEKLKHKHIGLGDALEQVQVDQLLDITA